MRFRDGPALKPDTTRTAMISDHPGTGDPEVT